MEQKETDNKEELDIEKELVSPELIADSLDFEEESLDELPV